jgi:hypothetical protein
MTKFLWTWLEFGNICFAILASFQLAGWPRPAVNRFHRYVLLSSYLANVYASAHNFDRVFG